MSYYEFDTPSTSTSSKPRPKPQPLDLSPPSITILSTSPSSSLISTESGREEVRKKMEQRVFASTKPFWDVAKEMFKKEKVQKQKSPSLTKEEVVVLNKRSSALGGRRLEGFGSRGEALTRCTSITMFYGNRFWHPDVAMVDQGRMSYNRDVDLRRAVDYVKKGGMSKGAGAYNWLFWARRYRRWNAVSRQLDWC
ncbi:hypothetical protein BDY24DRAFT_443145 [Mrakia frigida]|uniref:uncharacterized protein n=1 Tax=Mrakia frigida TaxID=29902 RepID=UPI003FCC1DF7